MSDAWAGRIFTNPSPPRRLYTETSFRFAPPRPTAIWHPEEPPRPPVPAGAMEAMARKLAAAVEAEIHRMLGLWVSECEPTIAWGPEGLLGLALAGDPGPARILVPSRLATRADLLAAAAGG
ncbi:hypothetical protein SAMN02799631_03253 [Methylobacterium sp. 174MFSha1.1]|uniref:hypothetical protein n=1 Tax=Methylobacterium sp. 174MFSha1.1 TaxID=1502749 RepID=UPI0008F2245B|nr:hypothetical protein [Methylobacterium sp. 174MFSha1.1]SFU93567.1 hypothetical protein SAMN02799631_03253 [Methylobacterium sp. 174MFSha1.1]